MPQWTPTVYVVAVIERLTATITRLDPRVVDAAPAILLCAIGQFSIWAGYTDEGPRAVTVAIALLVTLALVVRRRYPVGVAATVMAAWGAQSIVATSPSALWELVVLLLVAYAPGAHADGRRAIAGLVINVAGISVITAFDPAPDTSFFTPVVFGGGPWIAGRLVRRHWSQARQLDVLNAELERRRTDDVQAATRHERARIARELHDVVAHSISVMVIQAGAAEQVLQTDPGEAAQALQSIRTTGKSALADMRRMLGVLRSDADHPGLGPQPGLGDLATLVERMRDGGLDTRLRFEGDAVELAPGPALAAYRVVQEGLTNTLKHAGTTRVDVIVRFARSGVELEVLDEGTAPVAPNGSGHGLIGMRERMALYGGSLDVGPRQPIGWAVRARIPVPDQAAS
jgi:signal transduction histidine kinase